MKSGNLNFLEPSGPLQACNRTALPFMLQQCFHERLKVYCLTLPCKLMEVSDVGWLWRSTIGTTKLFKLWRQVSDDGWLWGSRIRTTKLFKLCRQVYNFYFTIINVHIGSSNIIMLFGDFGQSYHKLLPNWLHVIDPTLSIIGLNFLEK